MSSQIMLINLPSIEVVTRHVQIDTPNISAGVTSLDITTEVITPTLEVDIQWIR